MSRRIIALLLAAVLLLPVAGGCSRAAESIAEPGESVQTEPLRSNPYTFTDALNREITVDNPQRVAALMGSFAEIWLLAGGGLVAVSDDAFEDRGMMEIPETVQSLGAFNSPNVEELMAAAPDLVLLSSETQAHVALADLLEDAGIQTAYFSTTHFEDYLAMLEICTGITGRQDLYQRHGEAVKGEIRRILSTVPIGQSPRVLLLITYSGGAAVQDGDTMTGRMLKELRCVNLADEDPSLLNEFSVEHIIAQDPDFIFVIPMGNSQELAMEHMRETVESNPAWSGLSAVQNGRYLTLPHEMFLYKPNNRWADSYQYLSEILYGTD